MKRFLNMVADIFYPRCCPVCQKILADQRRMICPECEKELRPIGHPRCYKCGKPIETGEYCRDCQKHRHMYEQGRGIFVYDGIMRRSVTRYKYYGCREYGDFYARAMYRYAQKELREWKPDLIVPEIEAIATDMLVEIEAAGLAEVIPTARATKLTMNREGIRRLAAEELGLPTSPYCFADSLAELQAAIDGGIGYPCIVKPVMSSSGKGQSTLRGPEDV